VFHDPDGPSGDTVNILQRRGDRPVLQDIIPLRQNPLAVIGVTGDRLSMCFQTLIRAGTNWYDICNPVCPDDRRIERSPEERKTMNHTLHVGADNGLLILGNEKQHLLKNREVRHLAVPENGLDILVDRHEIMRMDRSGKQETLATIPSHDALCLHRIGERLFIGTEPPHLFERGPDGTATLNEAFETLDDRTNWSTPWGGPPAVRSMTSDDNGNLYVNVHVGGILRSTDGGKTWRQTIAIDADIHHVLFDPGTYRILAASARGLAWSDDGGIRWSFTDAGLHGPYCRTVGYTRTMEFVSASTGPHTDRAALYRRPRGGNGSLEKCTRGLPRWFPHNINTHTLCCRNDTVYFGTRDGLIFRSGDNGATWERLPHEMDMIHCLLVTDSM